VDVRSLTVRSNGWALESDSPSSGWEFRMERLRLRTAQSIEVYLPQKIAELTVVGFRTSLIHAKLTSDTSRRRNIYGQ